MTRGAFLKLQIPNLPYCEFHLEERGHRGPSNQFHESIHVKNVKKNLQINIFWANLSCGASVNDSDDGEVCVETHDCNEPNQWKQKNLIHDHDKHFTQEKLEEVFKQIMY